MENAFFWKHVVAVIGHSDDIWIIFANGKKKSVPKEAVAEIGEDSDFVQIVISEGSNDLPAYIRRDAITWIEKGDENNLVVETIVPDLKFFVVDHNEVMELFELIDA